MVTARERSKLERCFGMNINLTARYLQYLRKSCNFTQEELAEKLDISRQAVSKWETGKTVPDMDVLLKISKLYGISINDILEPKIQPQRITDFEQICTIPKEKLKEIMGQFDTDSLVIALMGASPGVNHFCEKLFPEIDFEKARNEIGRVRVETVGEMQGQIVSMINLEAADRKGGT